MAAIAPITIADGQATPVDHTFNPISTSPAFYKENGDASVSVIGENELVLSLKRNSSPNSSAISRAKLTLRLPVLEVLGSSGSSGYEAPPSVAYYLQATVECMLPDRSTGEQRKDLRVLLMNALANSQVESLIEDLENPY